MGLAREVERRHSEGTIETKAGCKPNKPIAQGIALGMRMDGQSPHRGKSLYMMMLLPLQGEYHMNTKSQGDAQG